MSNFVVISGCSGGGKSTLLEELARRGHRTVPEPWRRIVREELARGGTALPWADTRAFVHRLVALARSDYEAAAGAAGWTFFDRGLDAVSGLAQLEGRDFLRELMVDYRIITASCSTMARGLRHRRGAEAQLSASLH